MTDNKDLNNKFELEDDELTGVNGGNMAMQNLMGGAGMHGPSNGIMHGHGRRNGGTTQGIFTQRGQNPFGQRGEGPLNQRGQNPFGQRGEGPLNQRGQNPFGQSGENPFGQLGENPFGQSNEQDF